MKLDSERRPEEEIEVARAERFEFDDIIDPADTRDVILKFLNSLPPPASRSTRKHTIDNW